ncbi:MAG: 2-C-methyl-D-erythritol 4-phosphate cytidylyltransferase [Bacteroidales bacterium]
MKKYAIIVAGGTGSRMKGDIPKQFMLLKGKLVIQYSLEAFYHCDPAVILIIAIHPDYVNFWDRLCQEHKIDIPHQVARGGKTRFDSVKNGLSLIGDDGLVAVHDAARPVIDAAFILELYLTAEKQGSAIPAVHLTDTIRAIEGDSSRQLDRSFLRAIQTPQVFRVSELKRAFEQPFQPLFTDDASVMQSAGFKVHLTEGKPGNIKITHQKDIALAEVLMKL